MNLNFYKTYTLLKAVETMPVFRTFLKDTFFPTPETFVTEDVILEFRKGKRKMAPFVAPRVGGVTVDRDGYKAAKFTAPKMAPQRSLTVDDLMIRGIGESIISNRTPEQRQAEILAKDLKELEQMIARREEWMASQILFNGKAILKGYTDYDNENFVEQEIDYGFTNKVTLEGSSLWTDPAAEIYENLENWRLEVIEKTDFAPNIAIFGREALKAFRSSEKIQKLMDIRNMNLGSIVPEVKGDGTTFIGRIPELGLDIYTYDAWYMDDDKQSKPFIPADHILLARKELGGFAYGAITQMENGKFLTYEGRLVPKSWANNESEQRMLRLSTRAVPRPNDVDEWFVAKVV